MQQRRLFLSGALAGVIFFAAVYALATMVDGYSHVGQTVSEIGEQGSPAEMYFQIMNLLVALCLLVFAWSLYQFAKSSKVSKLPAFFMACFAISETGLAIFPSPHDLHNVFGLSATIGYMTPLVIALSWKSLTNPGTLITVSWFAFILISISIFLNLTPMFARDLYPLEYYGIVQRSLFVAFYGWCAYAGITLFMRR
jgi:hypothetical membrane protein